MKKHQTTKAIIAPPPEEIAPVTETAECSVETVAAPVVTPAIPPPAAIDGAWHRQTKVFSFDGRSSFSTAAAMFGGPEEALGPDARAARIARIIGWLRAQENAPWGELDGILRTIRFATSRLAREPLGSVAWGAEFSQFARVLHAAEADVEGRLVRYLRASDQERAKESARSTFEAARNHVPQAERIQDFATPAFSAREFVAKAWARGVVFTLAGELGAGFSASPGDKFLPSEMAVLQDFRFEIEHHLREVADAIGD
jgi:hypothetical protein